MKTGNRNLRFLCLLGMVALSPWAVAQQTAGSDQVGHVVAASGSLRLIGQDGQERKASRQTPIFRLDTIRVGDNGYLQLRFTDGSLLALRPGTEFKVAEYKFDAKQAGEEKAVFQLMKGGLRTITGAIGKKNPDEYKVETPVATIGIRGTHYGLRFCESRICGEEVPDGLYGGVADGAIGVTNQGGDRTFGNDRFFYVRDRDSLAQDWLEPKGIIFEGFGPPLAKFKSEADKGQPLTQQRFTSAGANADEIAWLQSVQSSESATPVYVESDNLAPSHEEPPPPPTITGTPAPEGGIALTSFKGHGSAGNTLWVSGAAVQSSSPTVYTDTRNGVSGYVTHLESANLPGCTPGCTLELGDATLGDGNGNGVFTWGRWTSGWTLTQGGQPGEAIGDWHVLYTDQATGAADLQDLQQRGVTATFDLYAATAPTDEQGNSGQYLTEYPPFMRVNFGQNLITDYALGVSFAATQRQFFGTLAEPTSISALPASLQLGVTCNGCGLSEGAGSASVAFAGSGAGYALTSWEMHTLDQSQGAVGAAVLVKHEYIEPPPISGDPAPAGSVALTAFKAHDADGNIIWTSGSTMQGEQPSIYLNRQFAPVGYVSHLTAIPLAGCEPACTLDQANADFDEGRTASGQGYDWSWGSWLTGWSLEDGDRPGEPYGSWHVLYTSHPTQSDELYSLAYGDLRASFHYLEGTTPTDAAGNLGVYHRDRPFMLVDFGAGQIAAYEVGVHFPDTGLDFNGNLAGPVGVSSVLTGFPLSVTCIGCDAPSTTSGWSDIVFVGSDAAYALNSWEMHADGGQGAVGAAVLSQTPIAGTLAPTDATALVSYQAEPDMGFPDRWFVGSATQGQANIYTQTWDGIPAVAAIDVSSNGNCFPDCALLSDRAPLAEWGAKYDGTQMIASWGRWAAGWDIFYMGQPGQGFGDWQFVYTEHPTSSADLDLLQSRGVIATFAYDDGPSPTDEMGNLGIYLEGTPSFEMNFGDRTIHNYLVGVYFPDTGRDFNGSTPTGISVSNLDLFSLDVTCTGCNGTNSVSGNGLASVAFVGNEAEHAITSWEMHIEDQTMGAAGVALLAQTSAYEPLPEGSMVFGRGLVDNLDGTYTVGYSTSAYTLETVNSHPNVVTDIASGTVNRGTAQLLEAGEVQGPGLSASWGRWGENWTTSDTGVPYGDFHFIQSTTATPQTLIDQLASAGATAYFEPVAGQGTSPTDGMGNVGEYGYYSPRATVNFGTGQVVDYFVQVGMPTDRWFEGDLRNATLLSQANNLELDVNCSGCSHSSGSGTASLYLVGGGSAATARYNDTGVEVGSLHAITAFHMSAGSQPQDHVEGTQLLEPASILGPSR